MAEWKFKSKYGSEYIVRDNGFGITLDNAIGYPCGGWAGYPDRYEALLYIAKWLTDLGVEDVSALEREAAVIVGTNELKR